MIPGQLQSLISGEFGFNFGADPIMGFGLMDFGGPPQPKTHLGLASCTLLKDYVKTYPCLRDVAILLKRFLAENDLNSAYQGKRKVINFFRRNQFLQRGTADHRIHEQLPTEPQPTPDAFETANGVPRLLLELLRPSVVRDQYNKRKVSGFY